MGVALAAALLAIGCAQRAPQPSLETVTVPAGPFEIVASGRRIGAGSFPNNGGDPFATIEVTSFAIRHHEAPVTITHGRNVLSTFWRVVRLVDAPRPALLASTTDFHLLVDEDGRLVTRSFGEPSTDMADYQWLDSENGQPGEPQSFGIEKVDRAGMELGGGRYLRLSYHTVLDVRTLQAFTLRPWIENGKPMGGLNGGGIRAIAFSPGRTQYVTVASGYDYEHDGEWYEAILVVDLPHGDAYGVRLDRAKTHYVELDDATPAWVEHYFRWTRASDGRERLVPRPDVTPLPWTGRLIDFGGDRVEYRLRPARAELRTALDRFLVERFGAKEAPNWIDPSRPSDGTWKVPGCDGVVATSFNEDQVGLYAPGNPPNPAACMDLVRKIAAAFDGELRAGKHQDLFVD